jgi:aminoglycoside/choline kinase family phosphotransferase
MPLIQAYLDAAFPGATVDRLAGDASTRIFYRIRPTDGKSRILMDYGEPFTGETDDMALARLFKEAELPVAAIVEASPEHGCLLLEDLGDISLESLLASEPGLAQLKPAVLLAAEVAERGTPVLERSDRAGGPALDEERFIFEMEFFVEHYLEGFLGLESLPPELRGELHALAALAADSPRKIFCHRDFHSRNLMVRPDGSLAMVDIQDARWGPDSYDLASLLRDAYADIEDGWLDQLIQIYLGALSNPPDAATFRRRFDIVAAQRMIKALGTFGYQRNVRGSNRYDEALRRTAGRLKLHLPRMESTAKMAVLLGEMKALE